MAERAEFEVELEDDVTPGAKRAESSLARLQRRMEKFSGGAVGRGLQSMASFATRAVAIGAAVTASVGAAVAALTVGMVDFSQRSRLAFSQLAKHGEVPEELFRRSIELAKRFGLDLQDTVKQVAKFRALQFSQDQSEGLIKLGADMMALGASTEEVSRIYSQLGQIQAKGKLQGEELIVLAENGLSTQLVYENLEKQMGKTREEILKMQQSGEIDSSNALNAIAAAIKQKAGIKEAGEAGERVANSTLSGLKGRLMAGFDDLFRRVGDSAEGPLVGALTKIGGKLGEVFSSGGAAEQGLTAVVLAVASAIEIALPAVESFIKAFGEGFSGAWAGIREGLSAMGELFGSISSSGAGGQLSQIGKAIGEVAAILAGAFVVAIGAAAIAINYLTAVWNFWKGIFGSIVDTIGAVIFGFTDFFANISAIFSAEGLSLGEKAVAIGKAVVMGIVRGIWALATLPGKAISSIASGLITAAKSTLGIASPSKVFEDIGRNVGLGMQLGVEAETPSVQGMTATMGSPATNTTTGGASKALTLNVNVTAQPGATEEDGRALGNGMADALDAQLRSYFGEERQEAA